MLPPQPPPEPPRTAEIPALHKRRLLDLTLIGRVALVIAMVGPLAVLLLPIYQRSSGPSASSRALLHARQLALSCKVYASDYAGQFPGGPAHALGKTPSDANAVFQELIDGGYLPDESLCHSRISAWCTNPLVANGKVDLGENAFGYFLQPRGDRAPSKRPLIASAWIPRTSAVYTRSKKMKGGGFGDKRDKAIVIQVDMSGSFRDIDYWSNIVIDPNTGDNALWPNPVTGFNADAVPLLPKE